MLHVSNVIIANSIETSDKNWLHSRFFSCCDVWFSSIGFVELHQKSNLNLSTVNNILVVRLATNYSKSHGWTWTNNFFVKSYSNIWNKILRIKQVTIKHLRVYGSWVKAPRKFDGRTVQLRKLVLHWDERDELRNARGNASTEYVLKKYLWDR